MEYLVYKCRGGCGYDLYLQVVNKEEKKASKYYLCSDCEHNSNVLSADEYGLPTERELTAGVKYEKKKWIGYKFLKK